MATVQDIYAGKVRAVANAGGTPRNKDVRKSNAAGKRAVHFFNQFLATMHDKDGKPKEVIDKDNLPSCLQAKFVMARILGQMYGDTLDDRASRSQWLQMALSAHKDIIKFAELNIPLAVEEMKRDAAIEGQDPEQIRPYFQRELAVCKEMVELLPHKIDNVMLGGQLFH